MKPCRGDIVGDFLMSVLEIDSTSSSQISRHVDNHGTNERLSRDLLEFKRLKNTIPRGSTKGTWSVQILRLIDEEMDCAETEPDYYQDFLSPHERAELLERLQPEMEPCRHCMTYLRSRLFDLEKREDELEALSGLSRERREEIEMQYDLSTDASHFGSSGSRLRAAGFLRRIRARSRARRP